jgi:hypothetical protein
VTASAYSAGRPAGDAMPVGFTNGGRSPLPGAQLAAIGVYRGVVVPLALGTEIPRLNERVLSEGYFGSPGSIGTVSDAAFRESGGAFRVSFDVLPVLVNPDPVYDHRAPSSGELEPLVRRALETWARQADLAAYDNDGADGIAGSADDDGVLDVVWVIVEAPQPIAPFTIPNGFELVSKGRRLRSGPVQVLGAPGGVLPDLRLPLDQLLATLGIGPSERFFPSGYPRTLSSLGRARLGWLPARRAGSQVDGTLADGEAVLVALSDLSIDAGFWLVERTKDHVFTSRVALRPDRYYQVTDSTQWVRGAQQVLPLSYHLGSRGPTVTVRWDAGADGPSIRGEGFESAGERSGSARVAGGARDSSAEATGYRWLRIGSDSVRVAVGGTPLSLP